MDKFVHVARAYQTLRRGGRLSHLDRELFTSLLSQGQGGTFQELLERIGMQKRYYSYRMVLQRMLDGEALECFEDELADELLATLAQIDKMIAFEAAYSQMNERISLFDMATALTPADRSVFPEIQVPK